MKVLNYYYTRSILHKFMFQEDICTTQHMTFEKQHYYDPFRFGFNKYERTNVLTINNGDLTIIMGQAK